MTGPWCSCGHTRAAHEDDDGASTPCLPVYCPCPAFDEVARLDVCALCEGPRAVSVRLVKDVQMAVCDYCWQKYGPARASRLPDHRARVAELDAKTPGQVARARAALEAGRGADDL